MEQQETLLRVDQLIVDYASSTTVPIRALDRLDLELKRGERLGILGESGCGKSSLALALLRLLPPTAQQSGSILFMGQRLDQLHASRMRQIRGVRLSLIFQEPAMSLHPMRRVGAQILDVIRAHRSWKRGEARSEMLSRLQELGLEDAEAISLSFPHQLSGGQKQRIAIALALACRPDLVIADEPTASLDAALRERILDLFEKLSHESNASWIFISHDPRVLKRMADRILVLYAGQKMEEGPARQILGQPGHPYTQALLDSVPSFPPPVGAACDRPPLPSLPGEPTVARGRAIGCRFASRCIHRVERCTQELPPEVEIVRDQRVWCWHPGTDHA